MARRITKPFNKALVALSLVALALALASCSPQGQQASSAGEPASSAAEGAAIEGAVSQDPYGKPWVSSIFAGNLPAQVPDAKDDLYLHSNYDYIKEHVASAPITATSDAKDELKTSVTGIIKDGSVTSPELEQLRIFYEQASDLKALEEAGADELAPYLRRIADANSLDELEGVLLSEDFPFSPWISTSISALDMKSPLCITVTPNLMFSDPIQGADIYQDTDDETLAATYKAAVAAKVPAVAESLSLVSLSESYEQGAERANQFFELEKTYGKDGDYLTKHQDAEYGSQLGSTKLYSLDELSAACPNFPVRETLEKFGEAAGEGFIIMEPEWLDSFNGIWTEENFELLRDMTEVKVLLECQPFIDPSFYTDARSLTGEPEPSADDFAYAACDKPNTFGQLLAKTYAEQVLPAGTAEELDKLTNGIIDAYIGLVEETTWLNAESREHVANKIDNMALNLLAPDGGYQSFESLELTPTSEGGTLFGNYLKLKEHCDKYEAQLIGQPARSSDMWFYSSPTTRNCFYEPQSNSINVLPGYVISSVYREDMSSEELIAGMGFVIAHEISHAFDYLGSQYNEYGEPQPIYSAEDVDEFVQIRQKLADRYSQIEVEPGWNVDGIAVSTEATADLCGLQAALAYAGMEGADKTELLECFARQWAAVYPVEFAGSLKMDAHPLSNLRVNVSAQMCDEFYESFGAQEGDAMYLAPDSRVLLWGPSAG